MAYSERVGPIAKKLLGFRVTDAFRKEIEAESIKRNLSVQDLIVRALEVYFEAPEEQLRVITFGNRKGKEEEEFEEQRSWDALWLKFMNTMPHDKVLIHANAMKFDLLHYKSSRKKKTHRRQVTAQESRK